MRLLPASEARKVRTSQDQGDKRVHALLNKEITLLTAKLNALRDQYVEDEKNYRTVFSDVKKNLNAQIETLKGEVIHLERLRKEALVPVTAALEAAKNREMAARKKEQELLAISEELNAEREDLRVINKKCQQQFSKLTELRHEAEKKIADAEKWEKRNDAFRAELLVLWNKYRKEKDDWSKTFMETNRELTMRKFELDIRDSLVKPEDKKEIPTPRVRTIMLNKPPK